MSKATKGSQLRMQEITSDPSLKLKKKLDVILKDELEWISPLEKENFQEYQLNSLCNKWGMPKNCFSDIWPSRQPQWDGIALGRDKMLYLFEAKSHKTEIQSGKNASDINNEKLIQESIKKMAKETFGKSLNDEELKIWRIKYYQISNRIVFSESLKRIAFGNNNAKFNRVKLIFLNFVNDTTWGKNAVSDKEWVEKYIAIWKTMGINEEYKSHDISVVNFDLNK